MIDYAAAAKKYRPRVIKTLLVGEAPPPNGKKYFYVPVVPNARPLAKDSSLPASIFGHYFGRKPDSKQEYASFLRRLKRRGIFLIDLHKKPILVRGNPEGVCRVIRSIPKLRTRMRTERIQVGDKAMIFLLPRKSYSRHIKEEFPEAKRISWIDFRLRR